MITDSFDNQSNAIINPRINENAPRVDACILTFSHMIESFVLSHYKYKQIASFWFATGNTPIYQIDHGGGSRRERRRSTALTIRIENSPFTRPMWAHPPAWVQWRILYPK